MDRRPDREEHRLDLVERLALAGDHEAEIPRPDDARVPADRSAQIAHRARLRARGHACGARSRDRARVDEDGARPRSVDDAGRDGLERLVVGERGEDDVDLRRQLLGRAGHARAACLERLGLPGRAVAHDELVAALEEALPERGAHVSETDQPHDGTRVLRDAHCAV